MVVRYYAASWKGCKKVTQMLLDTGMNVVMIAETRHKLWQFFVPETQVWTSQYCIRKVLAQARSALSEMCD